MAEYNGKPEWRNGRRSGLKIQKERISKEAQREEKQALASFSSRFLSPPICINLYQFAPLIVTNWSQNSPLPKLPICPRSTTQKVCPKPNLST